MKPHLSVKQDDAQKMAGEKRNKARPDPAQQQQTLEESWNASRVTALHAVRRQRERVAPAGAPATPPRRTRGDVQTLEQESRRARGSKGNDPMEVEQDDGKATGKDKHKAQQDRRGQPGEMEVEDPLQVADPWARESSGQGGTDVQVLRSALDKQRRQAHRERRRAAQDKKAPADNPYEKKFGEGAEPFYLDVTGSRRREDGDTTGPGRANMKVTPKVQEDGGGWKNNARSS